MWVGYLGSYLFYYRTKILCIMKISKKIQLFLFAGLISFLTLVSCQEDEPIQQTVNTETLSLEAPLTGLLQRVSMSNTASDNIIDSTSCFQVAMPYEVVVNGQLVAVNTEADFATVASYYGGTVTGIDIVTYVFPITVILPDYSETVVNNQQQYDALWADCEGTAVPVQDPIQCVSVVYPIVVFGYDSNFQLANTYTIDNDLELFMLIFNLSSTEYYAIDYPISIINAGGEVVAINNNIELLGAIQAAIIDCGPSIDPCENPHILTDGLILYMPFANEARDLVSMNLAIHNDNYPPQFVTDRNGTQNSAVSFSGNAYDILKFNLTEHNNIEMGDSLTVSLWFRTQQLNNESNLQQLFGKSEAMGNSNQPGFGLYLAAGINNTPEFISHNTGIGDATWTADLGNDNTSWHHLVLTIGDGYDLKIYRNGILANDTVLIPDLFLNTQTFDYYIGRLFAGYIDDVRVYRKTLTLEEIQTLYYLEDDSSTCLD